MGKSKCQEVGTIERRKSKKHVVNALAMILQFSLNMLVPICLMSALGYYLDKKFDTSFIMILFFFAGAIAGGRNIYKMAMAEVNGPARLKDENKSGNEKNT